MLFSIKNLPLIGVILATVLAGCASESNNTGKAGQGTPLPYAQARIVFDDDYVDFGRVPFDLVVERSFRFKNMGNSPLILQRVAVETKEGC